MHAKANLKKYMQNYWLFLFFIIVFALMALFKISLKEILDTVSHLKVWQLLILLILYGLISTSIILSRKYLLYALSTTVTTRNLIYIHFSSMAAHYSTPAKIGFPLTVYLLKKFEDVPYGTGTAMILIELIVSTGICGFIALIGSLFYFTLDSRILMYLVISLFALLGLAYFAAHRMMGKAQKNGRIYQFAKNVIEAFSRISLGKRNMVWTYYDFYPSARQSISRPFEPFLFRKIVSFSIFGGQFHCIFSRRNIYGSYGNRGT